MLIGVRNNYHTEQDNFITTSFFYEEPRDKSHYRETTSGHQPLCPHSIHTCGGCRHWLKENAWLNVERTHAVGGTVFCKEG